ncbi:hypothetical protein FHS55_002866 [Angulomicrobium tetraedrale]|uniref:DUF1178 family protein n=1 Tax=Ancylobacter tetraedralis TaxID=217068 RepID=A0A839ZBX9_9HYPH|nr:DUF1178 family protein [Ancylobacter tetraedralis]MBB3772254.1 hypothetical protein [Ancylobacter tetraedralis]
MILYRLHCAQDHDFESWFRDSAAYDGQKARGLVTCPVCGSADVDKAIMAPALGRGTRKRDVEAVPAEASSAPAAATAVPVAAEPSAQPVALMSEREQHVRAMLRAVRAHVIAHSDYVGDEFARLARRMHEGEEEQRAIHGEATPDEVRALVEDEIEVLPLPVLPDERN